ncbi:lysylphosphatidylglycerol synthase transmembrane domain-containing protein [Tsukamurella soli]|uniref:YbhN family protein n=1 Tax=Tsukamurella soli TaxID=644556 RepID=A0ABP8K9Q8_9ACTN
MLARGSPRRRLRTVGLVGLFVLFAVELTLGWNSLAEAFERLRTPQPGWLVCAMLAELAAMTSYARLQRRLLWSAGLRVPLYKHVALAYAAHSLSATLPGGPAFSTHFNFRQMRRFGASAAVASWCIALSAILSSAALAVITAAGTLAVHGRPHWTTLAGLAAAGLALTVGVRWVGRHPAALTSVTRGAVARVNRALRRPATRGLDQVEAFLDQLHAARLTPGHAAMAGLYAVFNWLFDAACLWLCFHAVGHESIGGAQVLLAYCAGMAAGTLTVIPGGIGIIDSALILGLVAGSAPTATAVATVVLYRILSFGVIVGMGWISWLAIRRRYPPVETPPT